MAKPGVAKITFAKIVDLFFTAAVNLELTLLYLIAMLVNI
jgi:hypothetical protein